MIAFSVTTLTFHLQGFLGALILFDVDFMQHIQLFTVQILTSVNSLGAANVFSSFIEV